MSEQLRKAAQEFLWTAEQYRSAHYNGTHMTADGTAAWAIREREFKAKDAALREALLAVAPSTPEPDERRRLSTGAKLIAEERDRQRRPVGVRDGEGYGRKHDQGHHDALALAGATYALPRFARRAPPGWPTGLPETWPWGAAAYKPDADRVRELVKAGALIAAAIDALLAPPAEKEQT